jgi:hypothetical protein
MRASAVIVIALVCAVSVLAERPHKRIVVQLRHDTGEVVSVSVLQALSSDTSLSITQFAQRAVPSGVAPRAQFWYVGDIFRLSDWKSRTFRPILWTSDRAAMSKLTVRDLRDGDVIVLHHPYP